MKWFVFAYISPFIFLLSDLPQGTASYYGSNFQGRRTSSGERFHVDSLTAAHKNYLFGTVVRVKNLKNDSIVLVKINDRLPQGSSRIIDLSYAAAKKLNFIRAGLAKVSIEIVDTVPLHK